jgi:hypothetical protein
MMQYRTANDPVGNTKPGRTDCAAFERIVKNRIATMAMVFSL